MQFERSYAVFPTALPIPALAAGSGDTVCGHFPQDEAFLGQLEETTFVPVNDIESFRIGHFADRQIQ